MHVFMYLHRRAIEAEALRQLLAAAPAAGEHGPRWGLPDNLEMLGPGLIQRIATLGDDIQNAVRRIHLSTAIVICMLCLFLCREGWNGRVEHGTWMQRVADIPEDRSCSPAPRSTTRRPDGK